MTSDVVMLAATCFALGAVAGAVAVGTYATIVDYRSKKRLIRDFGAETDKILAAWRRSNTSWGQLCEQFIDSKAPKSPWASLPKKREFKS